MTEISVATYSLVSGDNGEQVSIVFSNGESETVTDKHANFQSIVQALISKPEGYGPVVYDLANIAKTVGRKFRNLSDRVTTDGSDLYFDGDTIDGSLASFILKLLREDAQKSAAFFGGDASDAGDKQSQVTWEALVKFLELLYANPNPQSRESLYGFISRHGLTIRKDGHFIAYKGLDGDFGSKHKGYGIVDGVETNGTLFNRPGSILRFPRKDVNSNTQVGCAQGLHAGTHAYATNWASGGKLVAVAINPTNVVSVPDDCYYQKIRVCEYEVLNEIDPLAEAAATRGSESSSLWTDSTWDDNYDGHAIENVKVDDRISFDYVAVDGREQSIEDAEVDEVQSDYLKAFVPSKNGFRTFLFAGISNFENHTRDEEEADEEDEDEYYDGYDDEYEDEYSDSPSEDDESDEDADEEERKATQDQPKAQSGKDFFDGLADILHGGGGATEGEFLKKAQDFFSDKDLKSKAEKVLKDSGIGEIVDAFKEGLQSSDDASTDEVIESSTVSFGYTDNMGGRQEIKDARVEEVQAEYFKAFVPSKGGYRTFRFEGVSDLKVAQGDSQDRSEIEATVADLKTADKISVKLDKDGELLELDNATVLISVAGQVTVKLQSRGYKAFTSEDVVSITKH